MVIKVICLRIATLAAPFIQVKKAPNFEGRGRYIRSGKKGSKVVDHVQYAMVKPQHIILVTSFGVLVASTTNVRPLVVPQLRGKLGMRQGSC